MDSQQQQQQQERSEVGIPPYVPLASLFHSLKSFFDSILSALGLSSKTGSILLLGLDNSGKTTLLHRLRTGSVLAHAPTERPYVESFQCEGVKFSGWDLGGHEAVRHIWEDYLCEASAVVFLIDVNDNERFEEARDELDALISEGVISGVPLAILLNKSDMISQWTTMKEMTEKVAVEIDFAELKRMHGEDKIRMWGISVLKGEGYQDAFRWIASFL